MAVEAAGAEESLVEHINAVSGSDNDDARFVFETVHFDKNLVQSLLIFAASTTAGVALVSDGVDFVNENNGGGVFLGFLEEVAHARGADADEHFGKFGTRDGEEWHVGFASDGASHEGLASARIASEEDAAGDFSAEGAVFFGVFEKVDNFLKVLFGGFIARDVFEGNVLFIGAINASLGLAKANVLTVHVLCLAHHIREEDNERSYWQDNERDINDSSPNVGWLDVFDDGIVGATSGFFVFVFDGSAVINETLVVKSARRVFDGFFSGVIFVFEGDLEFIARDGDFFDVAKGVVGAGDNRAERNNLWPSLIGVDERVKKCGAEQNNKSEEKERACVI